MSSSSQEELIAQVAEITACDLEIGKQLLDACANNVEAAVALFFEQESVANNPGVDIDGVVVSAAEGVEGVGVGGGGRTTTSSAGAAAAAAVGGDGGGQGGGSSSSSSSSSAAAAAMNNDDEDDDNVRAPIAPIREQLIGPEDDNFYYGGRPVRTYWATQRVKVCPLRDFAREAALMEEQLQANGEYVPPPTTSNGAVVARGQRRAATMVNVAISAGPRESRLVDLFRPPTDIIYASPFQIARRHANSLSMWLLVNIQSDNFDSQVLNRDVWSNKKFRSLTRRHFIFWQVNQDSIEGRRFSAFYKCEIFPYVCVIDPQTGEEVLKIIEPKQTNILPSLQKFLDEKRVAEDKPTTSKRSMPILIDDEDDDDDDIEDITDIMDKPKSKEPVPAKKARIMELSEEEQIAMAIRNSMNENGKETINCNNSIGGNGIVSGSSKNITNGSNDIAQIIDENNGNKRSNNIIIDDNDDSMGSSNDNGNLQISNSTPVENYESFLGTSTELSMIKMRFLNTDGEEEVVHLKWPSDTTCKTLRSYICQVHPHIAIKDSAFKIICAFPRTSLEEADDKTLKQMGLYPSAYLHVTLD